MALEKEKGKISDISAGAPATTHRIIGKRKSAQFERKKGRAY